MMHVAPSSVWEITLDNGNYTVTIVNGDASFPKGIQNVQAEGVPIIDSKSLNSSTRWVEGTGDVDVYDGKLTITFDGNDDPAKICWLTIVSN